MFVQLFADPVGGGHLRVGPGGTTVDLRGGRGPWARFLLEAEPSGDGLRFQSVGHRDAGRPRFLSSGSAELGSRVQWFSVADAPSDPSARFHLVAAEAVSGVPTSGGPSTCAASSSDYSAALSPAQKEEFRLEGVLLLPSLVNGTLVDNALRAINAHLGQGGFAWDGETRAMQMASPSDGAEDANPQPVDRGQLDGG